MLVVAESAVFLGLQCAKCGFKERGPSTFVKARLLKNEQGESLA
jgi:hypothetical protein